MRKLVDPIRLFDAKARPMSSYDAMERRIALLERQKDRLLRILRHEMALRGTPEQQTKHVLH